MRSFSKHFSVCHSFGNFSDRNSHNLLMCEKLVMKLCSYQLIWPIFVIISLLPLACADLKSDKKALLQFAAAIPHGPKLTWGNTNGNAGICTSWIGIKCNSNGTRVISVRLPAVGLTGPIPSNTLGELDALRVLSLRSNYLNGSLPFDLLSLPSLRSLFLQHNNFTTNIPAFFPHHLQILDLSCNSFTGSIPQNIQYLTRLYGLYLQNNSLSGPIPDLIFLNLQHLNISYNKLEGSIPISLKTFPSSSFLGNPLLCGLPLKPCSKRKLTLWAIIAIAIVGGVAVIVLVVTVVYCCTRKESADESLLQRRRPILTADKPIAQYGGGIVETDDNKLVVFGSYINFDLEELLRASAEVIGKGSFGTTYKAVMEESMTVVVKRLNQVVVSKEDFEQQMELIERVGQHQNVVPLRAFFYSEDEKLLVYDYYTAGSLMTRLHGSGSASRTPFDWESRVKIAMGTARGIAHIHSIGGPGFTHGNIKSSNILIDHEMDACISDIGLVPIMNFQLTPCSQSPGYRAPEVQETNQHSPKSDVYSFGVLLLELLTRKQPIQSPVSRDMVNLPRWVLSVVREDWTSEVFDAELKRFHNIDEEMTHMLQIGMTCVDRLPENRPTIQEVVIMMEKACIRSPAF